MTCTDCKYYGYAVRTAGFPSIGDDSKLQHDFITVQSDILDEWNVFYMTV